MPLNDSIVNAENTDEIWSPILLQIMFQNYFYIYPFVIKYSRYKELINGVLSFTRYWLNSSILASSENIKKSQKSLSLDTFFGNQICFLF